MNVLALNCGSSSIKFAVFDTLRDIELISGVAQGLSSAEGSLDWTREGVKHSSTLAGADHRAALHAVAGLLWSAGLVRDLRAIGHRVVDGASRFSGAVAVIGDLGPSFDERCFSEAPSDAPDLLAIRVAKDLFSGLPQVAVFDSAFHQAVPPRTHNYALPYEWLEQRQVRRAGLHGTGHHRCVAQQVIRLFGLVPSESAIVIAHLGNGCACASVKNGMSVETTVGLTPLEGVVMKTRTDSTPIGTVDSAANQPVDLVIDALNKKSGLLGVSGLPSDMRAIQEAAEKGNPRAQLAFDVFCYVLAKTLASLAAPLGRLDALVFTGGIGESSALVRARVIEQLGFLGMTLDPVANAGHGKGQRGRITRDSKPLGVVVPTNEELMIAQETSEILSPRVKRAS